LAPSPPEHIYLSEDGWVSWKNGQLAVMNMPDEVMQFLRLSNPKLAAKYETAPAADSD
jgi:hypothetical protein